VSWRDPDREDDAIYKVVINHEEQYSIWPEDRSNPSGWDNVGVSGPKAECLAYIKEVWTDMRPLSLRKQMEQARLSPLAEPAAANGEEAPIDGDDLVKRLSEGAHPVVASLRPEKTIKAFKERIDLGYVHLRFVDTRGGTELGVRLDSAALDLSSADFENQTGFVHLEGGLTLNYQKVRCIADIDLQTLAGTGYLVSEAA
jgi:uncharacterized protein YbdZ (MbtH family)